MTDRRDPTRSAGLRKYGRGLVNRRVFNLGQRLRQAIQEHDVAGLREADQAVPVAFINWATSASYRLARADGSIDHIIEQTLLSPPEWPHDLLVKAVEHGIALVEQELRASLGQLDASEVSRLQADAATIEVRGIAGETKRRMLRLVVSALESKAKPETVMREVRKIVEKITRLRLHMMVNTSVVRSVNAGKLLAYESVGIERVGIDPEWVPAVRARQRDSVACGHAHRGLVVSIADAKSRKAKRGARVKANKAKRARRGRSVEEAILAAAFPETGAVAEAIETLLEEVEEAEADETGLYNILTAGDDRVCVDCEDAASAGPYTLDEARDLLPMHVNCRCAVVSLDDERFAQQQEESEEWF
jgi:hypothetical protein